MVMPSFKHAYTPERCTMPYLSTRKNARPASRLSMPGYSTLAPLDPVACPGPASSLHPHLPRQERRGGSAREAREKWELKTLNTRREVLTQAWALDTVQSKFEA